MLVRCPHVVAVANISGSSDMIKAPNYGIYSVILARIEIRRCFHSCVGERNVTVKS